MLAKVSDSSTEWYYSEEYPLVDWVVVARFIKMATIVNGQLTLPTQLERLKFESYEQKRQYAQFLHRMKFSAFSISRLLGSNTRTTKKLIAPVPKKVDNEEEMVHHA